MLIILTNNIIDRVPGILSYVYSTIHSHQFKYSLIWQTLICDVNAMTSESSMWTQEDKFVLEAQLLLATEGPLCLDPTPEVARVSNQLQFNYNKLNSPGLKRCDYS